MTVWIVDRVNALSEANQQLVKTWLQANENCSGQELSDYVDSL
jgi:uncharacterized protein YggL (DUF469 family)